MAIKDEERDSIPNPRTPTSLRLVTFNVNGTKTLKNYHPWSSIGDSTGNLSEYLKYMKADIISFQELKLQTQDITSNIHSIGSLSGYKSFVTVPLKKKGYSGVGVFIRIPTETDSEIIQKSLTVIKAEEGITGFLNVPNGSKSTYREAEAQKPGSWIGGYSDLNEIDEDIDISYAQQIDSEGRCMIVELNYNVVIISVYCPANSMCTEEGERFRQLFLRFLFERAKKLTKMGKEVVIMGDINVSVNLIDSDEWLKEGFKENLLVKNSESSNEMENFEELNKDYVLQFKETTGARKLLSNYVFDTTGLVDPEDLNNTKPILYDVCREKQGRRLKLYTVWNTFKNTRPLNIGSRIDLILTSRKLRDCVNDSNIWTFIYGSDHCPVYADFDMNHYHKSLLENENMKLEEFDELHARYKGKTNSIETKPFYKLQIGRGIESFFKARPAKRELENTDIACTPLSSISTSNSSSQTESDIDSRPKSFGYVSRKKRNDGHVPINNFFVSKAPIKIQQSENNSSQSSLEEDSKPDTPGDKKVNALNFMSVISKTNNNIPNCEHNEPCVLRSVKNHNSANKGKKFWCCPRNTKADSWNVVTDPSAPDSEFSCGYFKWAYK